MTGNMEINAVFPTVVTRFNIGRDLTGEELEFLTGLPQKANRGNSISLDTRVLEHEVMGDLKQFILQCLNKHISVVFDPITAVEPYITQSWTNCTEKGQFHHKHFHTNSFLSGVFYVSTSDDDTISIYSDQNDAIALKPKNYHLLNSDKWTFNVNPGDVLLFRSTIPHSVETKSGGAKRISLAFNTFLKGQLGLEVENTLLVL